MARRRFYAMATWLKVAINITYIAAELTGAARRITARYNIIIVQTLEVEFDAR